MTQYKFNIGATPQSVIGNLTWNANESLNTLQITDPFNSANAQTCTFTHDDLARQSTANCAAAWNQTFTFDPFGNISKSATVGTSFQATYSTSTNRMTLIGSLVPTYDANGNLTNDTSHAYTWDVEGKMLTVDSGTASGVCDTYDALGRMVEKATGTSCTSSYTEIVYAPSGIRLATMTGQTLQQASVPLVGGSEAVYNSGGLLAYRHSDHLGSSRFASTPSRTKYFDVAYAPYGEDYADSGTNDLSFTGQKKDTASWLYDFMFRKYNAAHGRWMSPDPLGSGAVNPGAPQTWNRYAYVANGPLSFVDPLGLRECPMNPCGLSVTGDASQAGPSDNGGGFGYGNDITGPNYDPFATGAGSLLNSPVDNPNFHGWGNTVEIMGEIWQRTDQHYSNPDCPPASYAEVFRRDGP
jgi:RHS repeat-associated protein